MTYKDYITKCMTKLSMDKMTRFIGYNTKLGSRMYGTLDMVPKDMCIEMPICENLMVGMAIGMALEGYKPVVCFERHDFMLLAMDAIVNHLDKLPYMSGNQYQLDVKIRAIVGGTEPLHAGVQHTNDYGNEVSLMVSTTDVTQPNTKVHFDDSFFDRGPRIIVEYKDYYEKQLLRA